MSLSRKLVLGLCAAVSALTLSADDWPHFGADGDRTRSTQEILGTPFALDWSSPLPSGGVSSPAVADGHVVIGTRAGKVRCYSESTGALLWEKSTGDEIVASPLIARGLAYVPGTDRKIHVFRLADGAVESPIASGGTEMSSPSTDGSSVFVGLGFPNRHVAAYGAVNWKTELEQVTYSSPAVANGRVYIGCNSGRYYSIDAASGSIAWSYLPPVTGSVVLSSPLVIDTAVYLLPGGETARLYRIDTDPAQWGPAPLGANPAGTNWFYTVPAPAVRAAPPANPGYLLQNVVRPVSSPVRMGNLVVFLIRFDQYYDKAIYDYDGDTIPETGDWITDTIDMTEYLVAVDPATKTQAWPPVQIATKTVTSTGEVPQLGCPSPAVFAAPGGIRLAAVASTLDANLRLYDASGALAQAALPIDTPTRASPAVANTRIFVATETALKAFKCGTNSAPTVPATYAPSGGIDVVGPAAVVSWSGATDPDADGLTYAVRYDDDGEVLLSFDGEILTGGTAAALPAYPTGTWITWAVRTRDAKGARSAWSALQLFRTLDGLAPAAPTGFAAQAGNGQATLTWTASTSTDVDEYRIAVREGSGAWGAYTSVGNVTSTIVGGLNNGAVYTFRLIARDVENLESPFVEASTAPVPLTLNGLSAPDLDDAIANAQPGDVIEVGAGTIVLSSTANLKAGVRLVGAGPHLTILSGPGLDFVIRIATGAGTAEVRSLTVTGGLVGIHANGNALVVRNVILRNNDTGLFASAGSAVQAVHCTVVHNPAIGVYVGGPGSLVRNSIVMMNGIGIAVAAGASPSLTYNNVAANTTDYDGAPPGTGSTSASIPFLDDFREPDQSANVDAADPADDFSQEPQPSGGRANQGAFGNTKWAARSASNPAGGGGGGGCGMVGLEALLFLGLLVRRSRSRYNRR